MLMHPHKETQFTTFVTSLFMNYSRITSSIEHVDYIAVRYSVRTFLCINYEFLQGFKNLSF